MIRTVTLNSGFDDFFEVSRIRWGDVDAVTRFASKPSGKGINLARVAHALGADVRAYSLVGEADEAAFARSLSGEGIDHVLRPVAGRTRHNLTIAIKDADTLASHAVAQGFSISDPDTVWPLLSRVIRDSAPTDLVVLNGSLPTGLPHSMWADVAAALHDRGAKIVLDIQGAAFLTALRTAPVLAAKPNEDEALVLPSVRNGKGSDESIRLALADLLGFGVDLPMVTLGARGVAFAIGDKMQVASCPVQTPRIAVGAGDAFLAGVVASLATQPAAHVDAVRSGLATAAAYVAGSAMSELRTAAAEFGRLIEITQILPLPG